MNTFRLILSIILLVTVTTGAAPAHQKMKLGENAALRYWSAFAQLQDSLIPDQQAKEMTAILDGTTPYNDSKYKDLVEKNRPALETMARASALPSCDWGVDYQLGTEAPVDYIRKALALGRLNVLYAFHLLINGDKDGAVRVLSAGLRFSHDTANGGTLFATAAAKSLLVEHLSAVEFALQVGGLSAIQRSVLQKAVEQLGAHGLDWQSAMQREFEIPHGLDTRSSEALARIIPAYLIVLNSPSSLPKLQLMIANAPRPVPEIIPNPKHVLEAEQELNEKLSRTRALLQ